MPTPLENSLQANVLAALDEDIAGGDLTAQLIPADAQGKARVILAHRRRTAKGLVPRQHPAALAAGEDVHQALAILHHFD